MSKQKYGIQLDFDCEDEPPNVYIADSGGYGTQYLQILENPKLLADEWSWDAEDWEEGELAKRVLRFMNGDD